MAVVATERIGVMPSQRETILSRAFPPRLHGAGVVITDTSGQYVLVVEEQAAKNISERCAGQISPPLETAKFSSLGIGRERRSATILGALTEVATDEHLPYLQHALRRVRVPHPMIQFSPQIRGEVALFVYEGSLDDKVWKPTQSNETQEPRWMLVDDFLAAENARPWGREIVRFVRDRGLLHPSSRRFVRSPLTDIPSPDVPSLEEFHTRRELRRDVIR